MFVFWLRMPCIWECRGFNKTIDSPCGSFARSLVHFFRFYRNHFEQTYTGQVHRILEPVFARLGVRHEARNLANGGMGTIQHGLGGGSFYGPDVSFLMWDSGKSMSMQANSSQKERTNIEYTYIYMNRNSLEVVHHPSTCCCWLTSHSRGIDIDIVQE